MTRFSHIKMNFHKEGTRKSLSRDKLPCFENVSSVLKLYLENISKVIWIKFFRTFPKKFAYLFDSWKKTIFLVGLNLIFWPGCFEKRVSIKIENSDLLITVIQGVLIYLRPVDLLLDILFIRFGFPTHRIFLKSIVIHSIFSQKSIKKYTATFEKNILCVLGFWLLKILVVRILRLPTNGFR